MLKKAVKKAAPGRSRVWTPVEEELLRKKYPNTLNSDLAVQFQRSEKSIAAKAGSLGFRKTHAHRSALSRQTAIGNPLSKRQRETIGRRGGKKGGPARARTLTAKRRKEISAKAIQSRWKKAGKNAARTKQPQPGNKP